MDFSFALTRIFLADGTVVEPPRNGMTLFTGPNNSGKSLLLRELVTLTHHHPGTGGDTFHWVDRIEIHREGAGEDFISWLNERGQGARYHEYSQKSFLPGRVHGADDERLDTETARTTWDAASFSRISHLLINDQWTDQRLSDQTSSNAWNQDFPPNHPTQRIWEHKETHDRFSDLFQNAFGLPISINRYVPQLRLQIGSTGLEDTPPPPSPELREAYSSLPYLAAQGDGMRAFANILLHCIARPFPLIVIDEPEAFLHPPQARLLGRYLALYTPSPSQVIVATHSVDFLNGVLEGNSAKESSKRPVALVRISRKSSTLTAHTLTHESVSEILDTPLLRYSNIISGLFHDGVVLCEAEGDCQFYAATFDVLHGSESHANFTFLHVNGKARLSDAGHKLRRCGIPTAIVTDFDFLNDTTKIKQALSNLGGRWSDIQDDVQELHRHAASSVVTAPASEVKKTIAGVIGNPRGRTTLTTRQVQEISAALKSADGWKNLKKSGIAGLSGEPHNAARRIIDYFAKIGVFLVPVGELECWVRALPAANKNTWLTKVFDDGHYKRPSMELSAFSAQITSYLKSEAPTVEA
ncbi:ATP-dependent nuclease [Streptomyces parvulus]